MFLPERKPSKLQASVKVSFTLLMSGNDGRCVLNKAFCVHTAQTVLSNGIFSEENPASPSAFTVSSTANKMPDYLGGVDCSRRRCQAAISIVNNQKKTFLSDVENCCAFSGSGPQPFMVFHYN